MDNMTAQEMNDGKDFKSWTQEILAQEKNDRKWIMMAFPDTRIFGERPLIIHTFMDAEDGPMAIEIRPDGVVTIEENLDDYGYVNLTPEILRDLALQSDVAVALYKMWDASPSGQIWAAKYPSLAPVG
jgi:hypothetical protein